MTKIIVDMDGKARHRKSTSSAASKWTKLPRGVYYVKSPKDVIVIDSEEFDLYGEGQATLDELVDGAFSEDEVKFYLDPPNDGGFDACAYLFKEKPKLITNRVDIQHSDAILVKSPGVIIWGLGNVR